MSGRISRMVRLRRRSVGALPPHSSRSAPDAGKAQTGASLSAGGTMNGVKALFFDVFGTLVDWRTSIAQKAQAIAGEHGRAIDGLAFADAWRAQYQPSMDDVRSGRRPFCKLDVLHRRNLDTILPAFGLDNLDEAARQ